MNGNEEGTGMTDLETLTAMYDRAGVKYVIKKNHAVDRLSDCTAVIAESYEGPNNFGLFDFTAEHYFNDDGSMAAVGAWGQCDCQYDYD